MENLFKIPLIRRVTSLNPSSLGNNGEFMELDGVGFYISYQGEADLTPESIRRLLMGREQTSGIIEAETPERAIEIFLDTWKGAKIGGDESSEHKALWIDMSKPILAIIPCERLRISSRDEFICGDEVGTDGNGEFGRSILGDYEDDWCPMNGFFEWVARDGIPQRSITVRGETYSLVTYEDMPSLVTA